MRNPLLFSCFWNFIPAFTTEIETQMLIQNTYSKSSPSFFPVKDEKKALRLSTHKMYFSETDQILFHRCDVKGGRIPTYLPFNNGSLGAPFTLFHSHTTKLSLNRQNHSLQPTCTTKRWILTRSKYLPWRLRFLSHHSRCSLGFMRRYKCVTWGRFQGFQNGGTSVANGVEYLIFSRYGSFVIVIFFK